jgi:hypothetical protein
MPRITRMTAIINNEVKARILAASGKNFIVKYRKSPRRMEAIDHNANLYGLTVIRILPIPILSLFVKPEETKNNHPNGQHG